LRAAPLNDLEEESRPVLDRLGENLEQIALIIAINQDTQFGQFAQIFPDRTDPFGQHLVVGRWHLEERDVIGGHGPHAGNDVAGRQRDVLHAQAVVIFKELINLGPAPALGRLVDGKLDPAASIGNHPGHQSRVFSADVLVVEARHQRKAHDSAVVVHPVTHLAFLNVGDDVVNGPQADWMERAGAVPIRLERLESRGEDSSIARSVQQRMRCVSIGVDLGQIDGTILVLDGARERRGLRSPRHAASNAARTSSTSSAMD